MRKNEKSIMRYFLKEILFFFLGLAVLIGLMLEVNRLDLPISHQAYLFKSLYVLFVAVFIWFALAMAGKGYQYLGLERPEMQKHFYFTFRLVQVLIVILGILTLLEGLGAKIAPLLGFFGVGGLATALAIQDSLINFISGVYIVAEKKIRLGDEIKSGDYRGRVVNVGWRSTHLKADDGSLLIIPNKDLAQNPLINYNLGKEVSDGETASSGTDSSKS